MRILLTSRSARAAFATAWACLPTDVAPDVRRAIRYVRDVKRLKGTRIRGADSTFSTVERDGSGYCFANAFNGCFFCDVLILRELFEREYQLDAVLTLLHELAHVDQFCKSGIVSVSTNNDPEFNYWEFDAWITASVWAERLTDACARRVIQEEAQSRAAAEWLGRTIS